MSAPRLAVLLAVACSPARVPLPNEATPGVTFPMHVMEGKGEGAPAASAKPSPPPPSAPSAPSAPPRPAQPDPVPLRMAQQYEIHAVWEDYRVRVQSVRPVTFRQPIVTERRMGRFALELWVGHELIERVRFDFPLLASEDPTPGKRRPLHEPPTFAGSVLQAKVMVPASPRARRAIIVDRATGNETALEWPPVPTPASTAPAVAAGAAAVPSASSSTPSSAAPAGEPHGAARFR